MIRADHHDLANKMYNLNYRQSYHVVVVTLFVVGPGSTSVQDSDAILDMTSFQSRPATHQSV